MPSCSTGSGRLPTIRRSNIRRSSLRAGLAPAAAWPGVREVRVLGGIGVIELDRPVDMRAATEAPVGAGTWLRRFRNLVYAMPPYISTRGRWTGAAGGKSR